MYRLTLKPLYICLYCKKTKSGRKGQMYCSESHKKMYWKKTHWKQYLKSQRLLRQKKRASTIM